MAQEAGMWIPRRYRPLAVAALVLWLAPHPPDRGAGVAEASQPCAPTRPDMEGPFYRPGAPERSATGSGLAVAGRVLGAPDCRSIPGARIEWWQANRQGRYDEAHRGSQVTDGSGSYRFTTDFPGAYPGRPPHIHFKVAAQGYLPLTTQLYLRPGEPEVEFLIVLAPQPARPPAGVGTSP